MAKPRTQHESLSDRMLRVLTEAGDDGLTEKELFRAAGVSDRARGHFRELLAELMLRGNVRGNRRGRLLGGAESEAVHGVLSVHPRGFGFVHPEQGETDIFVPPAALGGALSGDVVEVVITERQNPRGPVGRILRVVEPRSAEFVGQLEQEHDHLVIRPLRRNLPETIPVRGSPPTSLAGVPARWTRARLVRSPQPGGALTAEVVGAFGSGNALEQTLDAIVAEFEIPPPYSAGDQETAARVTPDDMPRENLEHLLALTIDPVDAKDHDDAISVQPGDSPGSAWIGVHIADVAAYVPPGSRLDAAAAERGFTAYLPGRTLPMLPTLISGDRCSLVAGRSRLAHTVFLEVSRKGGQVLRTRRCHSVIRVRQRLTFDAVQAFLDHGKTADLDPAIRPALAELAELCAAMRRRRAAQEEFLELAGMEVRVRCEEKPPRIVELVREEANAAHALVEEFMLAGNSAVAAELARRGLAGVYRTHPAPRRGDLEAFRDWAMENFGLSVKRLASRGAINGFLRSVENSAARLLLMQECLRALPRAGYSAAVAPHFGLGKECYCHFTSPIRRYADLVVHQQLRTLDAGGVPRNQAECDEIARRLTDQEEHVDSAFFAANDRFKLRYLQEQFAREPERLLEGIVARRTADGVSVFLPEYGLLGFLSRTAGRGARGVSTERPRLRSVKAGKTHKCGDFVVVQPSRIDCVRGELHLKPCGVRARTGPRSSVPREHRHRGETESC